MAIIISAPSGWGKTQHRLELMRLFKCKSVIDDWAGYDVCDEAKDCLVLTSANISELRKSLLESKGHTVYQPTESLGPFFKSVIEQYRYRMSEGDRVDYVFQDTSAPKASDRQVAGDHYASMKIQPWALMKSYMTREEYIGYQCGTVLSYIMRHKAKGGEQDLHKAAHHMQELSEYLNAVV